MSIEKLQTKVSVNKREIWIDNVKVIACILVVLGHFFQSMMKANILPTNDVYLWFDRTIYLFHVPLFFVCSGYLYQRYSRVNNFKTWKNNLLKKALVLGIPYFAFSTVTWELKIIFSSTVNSEIGGYFETLFLNPTAPYWFLYALFFIFMITPTFKSAKTSISALVIAIFLKVFSIVGVGENISSLTYVLANEVWFVLGMELCIIDFENKINKRTAEKAVIISGLFVVLSILVYSYAIDSDYVNFILGVIACLSIIAIIASLYKEKNQDRLFSFMARYTMPIFLMHTLLAAPFRIVLLKLGVYNLGVHVVGGILVSFAGPIIAAMFMKHFVWMNFFLYPGKYIQICNEKN